jgi:hypothetical protein
MYLLIGDSNLRQTFLQYKDSLINEIGVDIIFDQATNNESLKLSLEKERDPVPELVYISSILNEISKNTGKGKPTEGIIKAVTEEQNIVINTVAAKAGNENTLYLQCYPMLRQDPKWMEEKLLQIKFYMKEQHSIYSPCNVVIVGEPIIEASDLQSDKVHLNDDGKKKFYEKIKADLLEGQSEISKFRNFGSDWSNLDLSQKLSQKTPRTGKKRVRNEEMDLDEEEMTNTPKKHKKKEEESVLSILKSFMEEIKEDRRLSSKKAEELEGSIDQLKVAEIEIRQEVKGLKEKKNSDITFTATLREDLDAVENEALRCIVIVKKLKTTEKTTSDKAEMGRLAQTEAKKLVKEILGDDSYILYTTLLATSIRGLRVIDGQIPPFKIAFKSKDKGVEFREKAVLRSKETSDRLNKVYFTPQQCMATRIRTNLMWSIADKLKEPEKEIDCWVNQGSNKPTLQVKGIERGIQSLTFVSAMHRYKDKIDQKAKDEANKMAKRFFPGQVEKFFIVLKD